MRFYDSSRESRRTHRIWNNVVEQLESEQNFKYMVAYQINCDCDEATKRYCEEDNGLKASFFMKIVLKFAKSLDSKYKIQLKIYKKNLERNFPMLLLSKMARSSIIFRKSMTNLIKKIWWISFLTLGISTLIKSTKKFRLSIRKNAAC